MCLYRLARAAVSKTRRTQSDLVSLACSAAASISAASEVCIRQISRASREEPSGRGGLPRLRFFGIGQKD